MKALKKYNTVFNYTMNPFYFRSHSAVKSTQYTSSEWRTSSESRFILKYDIFFQAKDPLEDVYFLNYHSGYEIHCHVDDVEETAKEIIRIKAMLLLNTQIFLLENAQEHYHLLDFRITLPTEHMSDPQDSGLTTTDLHVEIINIKRILGILTLEEMSEEERSLIQNQR